MRTDGKIVGDGSNDRPNKRLTQFPQEALRVISDADLHFERTFLENFNLKTPQIKPDDLISSLKQRDESAIAQNIFHIVDNFSKIAPRLDANDIRAVFDSLEQPELALDARNMVALLYASASAKAKTRNSLERDVFEALDINIYKVLQEKETQAGFDLTHYLNFKLQKLIQRTDDTDIKSELHFQLELINEPQKLQEYVDNAYKIDAENSQDASIAALVSRRLFTTKAELEQMQEIQQQFSDFQRVTRDFISAPKNQTRLGPGSSSFRKALIADIEDENPRNFTVNFSGDFLEPEVFFKKRTQQTIAMLGDLAKQGILDWGFPNFLAEYGFTEFKDALQSQHDLEDKKIQELVDSFVHQDTVDDFENYLAENVPDFVRGDFARNSHAESFVNFLNDLRERKNLLNARVVIFDDQPNADLEIGEWIYSLNGEPERLDVEQTLELGEPIMEGNRPTVLFNQDAEIYGVEDTHPIQVLFHQFNPYNAKIDQSELADCVDMEDPNVAFFEVVDALPHAIYYLFKDNPEAKDLADNGSFTLGNLGNYSKAIARSLDESDLYINHLASFFPQQPKLLKIVFVEGKDGSEGSEALSPDLSLSGV